MSAPNQSKSKSNKPRLPAPLEKPKPPETEPAMPEDPRTGLLSHTPIPNTPRHLFSIDGALLEGGGQTIRNAFAISALTGNSLQIENIRKNRPKGGGLGRQHLAGINLVNYICSGSLCDGVIGSTSVKFHPGQGSPAFRTLDQKELEYSAEVQGAGSIGLMIQISLPVLLFLPKPCTVTYRGGTNAEFSPVYDYFERIFLPLLRCSALNNGSSSSHDDSKSPDSTAAAAAAVTASGSITSTLVRRGFFPKGLGEVRLSVQPLAANQTLSPIEFTQRGLITEIHVQAISYGMSSEIAQEMTAAAEQCIRNDSWFSQACGIENGPKLIVEAVNEPMKKPASPGAFIIVSAKSTTGCLFAATGILDRAHTPKDIALEAATELMAALHSGGCLDRHMQDQLIIYASLAKGKSRLRTGNFELHTVTALHWARVLLGVKISVIMNPEVDTSIGSGALAVPMGGKAREDRIIEIEGIGYTSRWNSK